MLIFWCLLPAVSAVLTFQVEPKQVTCFKQHIDKDEQFTMDFEVVRGGLLDVKLRLVGPDQMNIIDKIAFFNKKTDEEIEREGRVEHTARMGGIHEICFDNRMSRWTAKVVSFHVHTGNKKNAHEEIAKLEHLGPVVDSVINIADKVDLIEKTQKHMRTKERNGRDEIINTNWRVQWFAIGESLVLLGVSFFQVRSIRHWFTDAPSRGGGSSGGRV